MISEKQEWTKVSISDQPPISSKQFRGSAQKRFWHISFQACLGYTSSYCPTRYYEDNTRPWLRSWSRFFRHRTNGITYRKRHKADTAHIASIVFYILSVNTRKYPHKIFRKYALQGGNCPSVWCSRFQIFITSPSLRTRCLFASLQDQTVSSG